ncbi:MAG: hypothetical protein Q7U39_16425 [Nitrospira sp.]|nr:hypothetical protein [Nitrospira sp.]
MATTTTRKPAQAPVGGKRPALRAHAEAACVAQPSDPSSSLEDSAAYAIGYHAGMAEGQRIGAERERAALTTEESIGERINRMLALEMYPLRERATDIVMSWIIYSTGAAIVVGWGIAIWRFFKWM